MKWLRDNPLGMALAGISGVFVLLAAVLAIVWTLPVAVETAETAKQESDAADAALIASQVGPLSEFKVIDEKPVFNESRLPVIVQLDASEPSQDDTVVVRDMPDVRLTGVIITPSMRIASLTPADNKQESVMAHEGEPLTGPFVGWQVSTVNPRDVVLESLDGQQMELELQIHDTRINEPPKPEPPAKTGGGDKLAGEDGEPLSRAEQIRQRIAQRREELRREQEDQQAQRKQPPSRPPADAGRKAPAAQDYQSAIRALMNNSRKDPPSDDKKDG